MQPRNGVYTVGDFMTTKEELHVVKPTTTVDEGISCSIICFIDWSMFPLICLNYFLPTALEILVENRITGFPVVDDDWTLVRVFFFRLLI